MSEENYEEFGAAYVDEKFSAAKRAAKSFVKNLLLINLLEHVTRIEFDGFVYDVEATPVQVDDVSVETETEE